MSQNLTQYNFLPSIDNGYYLLGENVSKYDLLQADEITAKAYKINYLDYAVVGDITYGTAQTSTATGRLITDTTLAGQAVNADSRNGLLLHSSSNNIFVCSNYSAANGLQINKFNKGGDLLNSVAPNTATSCSNNHLLELSNGNIAAIYNSSSSLVFAIYDENFNVIKAETTIIPVTNTSPFSACVLSGGGFAIVYQDGTSPLLNNFVTYDNSGNVVTAIMNIWTRTGTSGSQYHKLLQLSDGNLVLAVHSANATGAASIGLFYGIFTVTGGVVKAMTNLKTVATAGSIPNLAASSNGYFSIGKFVNADGIYCWVFNNAGTLQGSPFYSNSTASNSAKQLKLLTNNTEFYFLWSDSNDSKLKLTKIPTTGTNYLTTSITLSVSNYNFYIDAFLENNAICYATNPGTGAVAPQIGTINLSTRKLVSINGTTVGTAAGVNIGSEMRLIPGGERSFVLSYIHLSTTITRFVAGKYARTAILGVSKSTKNSSDYAEISLMPGIYRINLINAGGSSLSKSFNMTQNNFLGNKGSVNGYVVYLQGMSV